MKKMHNKAVELLNVGVMISILVILTSGLISMIQLNFKYGFSEIILAGIIGVYFLYYRKSKRRLMREYASVVFSIDRELPENAFESFPLPVILTQVDSNIMWCNDNFSNLFEGQNMLNIPLSEMLPDINWEDVLKAERFEQKKVKIKDKNYTVIGNVVESSISDEHYHVVLYFLDTTEYDDVKQSYDNEKTDIAFINIDNFDDIFQKMDDLLRQQVIVQIDKCVSDWVSEINGVLKKVERDRYFVLFENVNLPDDIHRKFDVLDNVRKIGESVRQPITISIGVGAGGTIAENDNYARSALDMVLGRGGDQAAVKDSTQYKFYGGKSREYEKSTRVKTRAVAFALKDFIANADKVIFMGHRNADYDCFGAAIGLQRFARSLGKKPYIVLDNSPGVRKMMDGVHEREEYNGLLISGDMALEIATQDTLIVILDTHRMTMLPCPDLLEKSDKVVLIDHHRRSTDFIPKCSLMYHEPYASSTCEMVTEILEYVDTNRALTPFEAECLYLGIIMDTKNFFMKTGVRTFEAASWLKKCGVDTLQAREIFSIDKIEYERRADIVRLAKMVTKEVAVAVCYDHYANIRVLSSQAADEMLTINGVRAAFVIYYATEDVVAISGRSFGDINVQLILEKLGGGGHMTVAGAQFNGSETIGMVQGMLEEAIQNYMAQQNS